MPDQTLRLRCPSCEKVLKISEALRGKAVRCPSCQKAIRIPLAKLAADSPPAPQPPVNRIASQPNQETPGPIEAKPRNADAFPLSKPHTPANQNLSFEPPDVSDDLFADLELPSSSSFPSFPVATVPGIDPQPRHGAGKPAAPSSPRFDYVKEIKKQLSQPIKRRRTSIMYRLCLGVLSMFMMAMPLAYVAFVALTTFLVYHYTFHLLPGYSKDIGLRGGRATIIIYTVLITPVIAGITVIIFMCKPIFFSIVGFGPGRTRTLTRTGEPVLFELVDRICETIRAPKPLSIEVDSQVNASASYGAGFRGIFKSELVLRIGVPLVAGLSVRQLSGVLAHEFGHFSQGAGMRAQLIISAINQWFAKVVYGRDSVDEMLDDALESSESAFVLVLWGAKGCVVLVRGILWCFMFATYAASTVFSRQMEFDADRYEIGLVGSDAFISSNEEFHRLAYANHKAMQGLMVLLQKAVLIDNIPRMIQVCRDKMTAAELAMIDESITQGKTGFLDTHPCSRQRNEAAAKLEQSGVFTIDRPARELFQHYDALCVNVTNDFYRNVIGRLVDPAELQRTDQHLHVLFQN